MAASRTASTARASWPQTPSANGPHDPETATQFELGAKAALTPELSFTAAAFTIGAFR